MALFGALPTELVQEIVETLCLVCGGNPHDGDWDGRCCLDPVCGCANTRAADRERVSALAALCLTSRQLNAMARAHLYHRPLCDNWWHLAATLLEREDLASLVRELRFSDPRGVDHGDCAPQLVAYFKDKCQVYLDAMPALERGRRGLRNPLDDGDRFVSDHNVTVDIIVSLSPNLERLHATLGYFDVFRFCPPRSLPRLQSAALSHADTEYGLDLGNMARLFNAAPGLTDLAFYMVDGCANLGAATLDKLISLTFQSSALDAESLKRILRACPNLKTLDYEAGGPTVGDDQFTGSEARDAILAYTPKLTTFRLHTDYDDSWQWNEAELEELVHMFEARGISFQLH